MHDSLKDPSVRQQISAAVVRRSDHVQLQIDLKHGIADQTVLHTLTLL
jgi:hypothetical protein